MGQGLMEICGNKTLREVPCHTGRRPCPLILVGSQLGGYPGATDTVSSRGRLSLLLVPEPGELPQAWSCIPSLGGQVGWWCTAISLPTQWTASIPLTQGKHLGGGRKRLRMSPSQQASEVPRGRQRGKSCWVQRDPPASFLLGWPCVLALSAWA